jgi:hypothetical protein
MKGVIYDVGEGYFVMLLWQTDDGSFNDVASQERVEVRKS